MPPKMIAKRANKRDAYTSHACVECQRRKVKCSGEDPCHNCRARGVDCHYTMADGDFRRKPTSRRRRTSSIISKQQSRSEPDIAAHNDANVMKEQLRRLQQKMDTIIMQHSLNLDPYKPGASVNSQTALGNTAIHSSERHSSANWESELFTSTNDTLNLERMINHTTRSIQFVESAYGETDTFVGGLKWMNSFAVASQICTIRSSAGMDPTPLHQMPSKTCAATLPSPSDLKTWLNKGLMEFECYFPCLHKSYMIELMSKTLRKLGFPSPDNSLVVTQEDHSIISILLILVAYGQLLSTKGNPSGSWPGSYSYWQSRRLMQHFEGIHHPGIEHVIYHTVSATYLLSAERLRIATVHVMHGLHAALLTGLSQSLSRAESNGLVDPSALWIVLDFVDKRITQKCGIAYFVRDAQNSDAVDQLGTEIDVVSKAYLQTTFNQARLWETIWDSFLAPAAPLAGNWVEIQVFDARILALKDQTPSSLSWSSEWLCRSIDEGESEIQIRRRLTVFLRYQGLRLSLQHKRVDHEQLNLGRFESCFSLSLETLEAVGQYLRTFGARENYGYILTASLVEAIYYLTLGQRESTTGDYQDPTTALKTAGEMLQTLSNTVTPAARAFEALKCVLKFDMCNQNIDSNMIDPALELAKSPPELDLSNNEIDGSNKENSEFSLLENDAIGSPKLPYQPCTDFDSFLAELLPDMMAENGNCIKTNISDFGNARNFL